MLQLAKDERGYLRRRELAVAKPDPHDFSAVAADAERKMLGLVAHVLATLAHEPLHRIGGARRVGQQPALRLSTDVNRVVLRHRHHGRNQRVAVLVADTIGTPSLT
jgi:hypothetical protein